MDLKRVIGFRKPIIQICYILLMLITISRPAFAQTSFTFIEFNTAFSLGLSLPLIIIAFMIRERINNSWWFLVFFSASLLGLLLSLASVTTTLTKEVYSACAIFITLATLLPRSGSMKKDANIRQVMWCQYLIAFLTAAFIFNAWHLSLFSNHYVWAGFSCCLIIISMIYHSHLKQELASTSSIRFNVIALLNIAFCITVFMQPHWQISPHIIVIISVAIFLLCLTNYSWLLSTKIKQRLTEEVAESFTPKFDELKSLSRDAVTNLPSQAQVLRKFDVEVSEQASYNFAVLAFKPINFSNVNHLLGHHNSDLLLLQLAYCLQKQTENNQRLVNFNSIKQPVRIARLPSLQFLVILDLTHNEHEPQGYIEDLCRELSDAVPDAISFKSFSLNFELAFGVDFINEQSDSLNQSIAWAGDALLEAEQQQQAISFYNHKKDQYTDNKLLKMEQLKQAVKSNALLWHCQPQIHLITKELIGFQLQALWQQNTDKIITLDEYLEIAENSGELYHIIQLLIDQACQISADNQKMGINKPITVNLSSINIFEDTLVEFIEHKLTEYQLEKSALLIEIPESALLTCEQKAKKLIDHLKSVDIKVAIGNFSGSYEALRYLRRLAISQIKIDCKALSLHEDRQTEKAIINALVNLAKVMHIPLVGFNINSISALELFQEIGGIYAQGNVISPSIETIQLPHWISAWQAQNTNI